MLNIDSIKHMDESQLRDLAHRLLNQVSDNQKQLAEFSNIIAQRDSEIAERDRTIQAKDQLIDWKEQRILMLTHEMAVLKRWKFGRSREGLNADQLSLLDETIDADLAAIETELDDLRDGAGEDKPRTPRKPCRAPLPPDLPRTEFRHEPDSPEFVTFASFLSNFDNLLREKSRT